MTRPGHLSAATFGEQLVTGMSGCTGLGRSRFGRRVSVIQEWWKCCGRVLCQCFPLCEASMCIVRFVVMHFRIDFALSVVACMVF